MKITKKILEKVIKKVIKKELLNEEYSPPNQDPQQVKQKRAQLSATWLIQPEGDAGIQLNSYSDNSAWPDAPSSYNGASGRFRVTLQTAEICLAAMIAKRMGHDPTEWVVAEDIRPEKKRKTKTVPTIQQTAGAGTEATTIMKKTETGDPGGALLDNPLHDKYGSARYDQLFVLLRSREAAVSKGYDKIENALEHWERTSHTNKSAAASKCNVDALSLKDVPAYGAGAGGTIQNIGQSVEKGFTNPYTTPTTNEGKKLYSDKEMGLIMENWRKLNDEGQ